MPIGKFITFEGGEGTGKTTQSDHLARRLGNKGVHVLQTREPGGTKLAEEIRDLLLAGGHEDFGEFSEALLFSAARDDHLTKIIRPALHAGSWVICDRYIDSTSAYQGKLAGVSEELLSSLETIVVGNTMPHCTLVLDMPVEKSLTRARVNSGKNADRYEVMDINYHKKIRDAFLDIAEDNPERCVVIDASGTESHVADKIWQVVQKKFSLTTA